jgi:hypothetical protein
MKIQRNWFVAAALLLPILFVVFSVGLALASPAVASSPTYSFDLTGPQTNKDPGTNNTLALTGAGSFDPSTGTVVASGAFAIFSSSGSPLSSGTWKATGFDSFCSRGGPNSGTQGGVLVITVTFFPHGGQPITGLTITVNCLVGTGCSAGAEGITVTGSVGNFTDVLHGRTLFHLNG